MRSYGGPGTYIVAGYPSTYGTTLVANSGFVNLSYDNTLFDISQLYHAPGSSGGPLFDASNYIVGVVRPRYGLAELMSNGTQVWTPLAGTITCLSLMEIPAMIS